MKNPIKFVLEQARLLFELPPNEDERKDAGSVTYLRSCHLEIFIRMPPQELLQSHKGVVINTIMYS